VIAAPVEEALPPGGGDEVRDVVIGG
jgi:hypothetical protein